MYTQIKNLIKRRDYFEALILLNQELSYNFDLSDTRSRNKFNELYELKSKVMQKVLISANMPDKPKAKKKKYGKKAYDHESSAFEKFLSANMGFGRSFALLATPSYKSSSAKNPTTASKAKRKTQAQKKAVLDQLEQGDFSSSSGRIEAIYITKNQNYQADANLHILLSPVMKETLPGWEDTESWERKIAECKEGKYVEASSSPYGQRRFYYLKGYNDDYGSVSLDATSRGLRDLVKKFSECKHEKVNITFSDFGNERAKIAKGELYYLIQAQLAYLLHEYEKQNTQTIFTFQFDDRSDLEIFHSMKSAVSTDEKMKNVIIQRGDPKERILQYIGKALTQNEKYAEMLESMLKVIDYETKPILIMGEPGVGKSELAKILHSYSKRNSAQFKKVNCGGLNDNFLHAELFGSLQGSYTGSVKDRIGKVELAEGGTLFLDEIDRTGQSIRNALITFVEDKFYEPLGGDEKKADVRLIFGTNKDIEDLISKGQFEDDFFARISHRIITIPPLRERKEDIPLIVEYTIKQQNEEKGTLIEIEDKAVEYLKKYDWPRNVRELMSYVSRVHTECLADGEFRITLERVQKSKLSSKNIITSDDYLEMIATLQKLLSGWDPAKGNFLDEIVKPVIAKLYIDDCFQHLGKQEKSNKATEIIGLSGGRGHDSIYYRFFEKYPEVREKLGL